MKASWRFSVAVGIEDHRHADRLHGEVDGIDRDDAPYDPVDAVLLARSSPGPGLLDRLLKESDIAAIAKTD